MSCSWHSISMSNAALGHASQFQNDAPYQPIPDVILSAFLHGVRSALPLLLFRHTSMRSILSRHYALLHYIIYILLLAKDIFSFRIAIADIIHNVGSPPFRGALAANAPILPSMSLVILFH